MPRKWVKLFCYERLHGSMQYQLSEAEQSVWDKLLCFAGLCDQDGRISDSDGHPFPHSHIAYETHTSEKLLESTIKKCLEEGRLKEESDGFHITNWGKYQSEYGRQKAYQQPSQGNKPASVPRPAPSPAPAPAPKLHDIEYPDRKAELAAMSRFQQLIAKEKYPDIYGARTPEEDEEYKALQAERIAQAAELKAKFNKRKK